MHSLSRRLIRAQHATCSVETKVCTSSVYAGQSVLCMTLSSSSTTRVQEFCGVDPLPRRFQGAGRGTYIPKLHLVTLSALGWGEGKGKAWKCLETRRVWLEIGHLAFRRRRRPGVNMRRLIGFRCVLNTIVASAPHSLPAVHITQGGPKITHLPIIH